ncbi:hypothetical protein SAMN05421640_2189 [Ekhidna lutea]|uniref:DUF6268 domain-containing protein n=2 Tax=Ekhidna lutea TaxID=447679 RepID=A0A239JHN7_EKHLU|nr:hypothetical protein SAMN05421640_2189 [Ekhidna lutea]
MTALCHWFVEIRKIDVGTAIKFPILADSMRKLLVILALITFHFGQCQYLDLAKIEYAYLPGDNANFEYQRQRVLFNIPFKLNKNSYVFAGLDYSNIQFKHKEEQDSYDKTNAESFKSLGLTVSYTFQLNDDWIFGAQISPSFNSNLEGDLKREDLLASGLIVFVKDKKGSASVRKPFRIITGLYYNTNTRLPFPLPFISYYRKFRPKWSYTIGAPYSNLQYHLTEKHRLKIYAEGDGFNTSLQNGVIINDNLLANRLRMFLILTGVRYEYNIAKHVESYINITRTVFSDVQLRDGKENVFIPAIDDAMLYRIGVRCKI